MTPKFFGVTPNNGKWRAQVRRPKRHGHDGELARLGNFLTEREAAEAVDDYVYDEVPELAGKANFPRGA